MTKLIFLSGDSSHNGKPEVPEKLNDGHVRNTIVEPDNKGEEYKQERDGVGVRDKETEEVEK